MFSRLKNFSYSILSLALPNGVNRVINDEKIRFPVRVSRYYEKNYESSTQFFLKTHANGCSVDVGAHIGLYTVILSRISDEVIALEPTTDSFSILSESLRINECKNVIPLNVAASDSTQIEVFYHTQDEFSSANSLSPLGNPIPIMCINLDIFNRDIGLLKIDAEGAEFLVLKGAEKTLPKTKFVHLAIHTEQARLLGYSTLDILEILKPHRPSYRVKGKAIVEGEISKLNGLFDLEIALNGYEFRS